MFHPSRQNHPERHFDVYLLVPADPVTLCESVQGFSGGRSDQSSNKNRQSGWQIQLVTWFPHSWFAQ